MGDFSRNRWEFASDEPVYGEHARCLRGIGTGDQLGREKLMTGWDLEKVTPPMGLILSFQEMGRYRTLLYCSTLCPQPEFFKTLSILNPGRSKLSWSHPVDHCFSLKRQRGISIGRFHCTQSNWEDSRNTLPACGDSKLQSTPKRPCYSYSILKQQNRQT